MINVWRALDGVCLSELFDGAKRFSAEEVFHNIHKLFVGELSMQERI
jgi:hypothetical protein